MFVQYDGNNSYTIAFGHKTVNLYLEEIEEIKGFNFKTNKPIKTSEELEEELEKLKDDNFIQLEEINALIKQMQEILE